MPDPKPEWLDKVKKTYYHHQAAVAKNPKHTLAMTAKELNKAIGPVSEELMVAQWLKTHEAQLFKFDYIKEALEWIRSQKHKQLESDPFD